MWSAAIATRGGEATVHVPGHYPGVLAQRLRPADERFVAGAKLPAGRDEYLELTALVARRRGDARALVDRALPGARDDRGAALRSASSRSCSSTASR